MGQRANSPTAHTTQVGINKPTVQQARQHPPKQIAHVSHIYKNYNLLNSLLRAKMILCLNSSTIGNWRMEAFQNIIRKKAKLNHTVYHLCAEFWETWMLHINEVHTIREIIEDCDDFSEGEYLVLMNCLKKISKNAVDFLTPVELTSLVETNDAIPRIAVFDQSEVITKIHKFIANTKSASTNQIRVKYTFCMFAYIFQNYGMVQNNPRFGHIILVKLTEFMSETIEFYQIGKTSILLRWLEILQKDFGSMLPASASSE